MENGHSEEKMAEKEARSNHANDGHASVVMCSRGTYYSARASMVDKFYWRYPGHVRMVIA